MEKNKKIKRSTFFPFYYIGMSGEEFQKEFEYYGTHVKEVKEGTYKPLWEQREERNK